MPARSSLRIRLAGGALIGLVGIAAGEVAARTPSAQRAARAAERAKTASKSAQPVKRTAGTTASDGPVWTAGEREEATCTRARRKLWQPGEGWVVKRVNICP